MLTPEEDFHAWALNAAQKARTGTLTIEELEQVAEELEDMAGSARREIKNRLTILLGHLLKWQYQPDRKGRSWESTITEQRIAIQGVLKDNPSLRPRLPELGEEGYRRGIQLAVRETTINKNTFPTSFEQTGWTWEQVLNEEYFPN